MDHYSPEDFDEKDVAHEMGQEESFLMEEENAAALLLSDQLMDDGDDDESEIYEMVEDDEDEEDIVISATSQPKYSDDMDESSFYFDEDSNGQVGTGYDEDGLVQENPFEPVYPATPAGLLFEPENDSDSTSNCNLNEKGVVLEALSLDNILPAGSRRRRN